MLGYSTHLTLKFEKSSIYESKQIKLCRVLQEKAYDYFNIQVPVRNYEFQRMFATS